MEVFPYLLMPSDDNSKSKDPKVSRLPFLMRTQAMGSGGWEGYTVGFTLVGCIIAGAGAGYLLDSHFKTSYWLPILFFVGVIAGFREMWIVLQRVQSQEDQKRRDKAASTPLAPTPSSGDETELPPERKRIFEVPPPPFETSREVPKAERSDESVDDIMKRLLAEADDDLNAKDDEKSTS